MTEVNSTLLCIPSILDTDAYKLSMQQAVLEHYPTAHVTYHFTNRSPDMKYNDNAFEWLKQQISLLSTLSLKEEEYIYLRDKCTYYKADYLNFLRDFRFRPQEQVELSYDVGALKLEVKGLWTETILYEVPLLALISEGYFRFVDTDWQYESQEESAKAKARQLVDAGVYFSEFGTRRRRSFAAQEIVIKALVEAVKNHSGPGALTGTSNVHFSRLLHLKPIGTIAHEWYMGIAALEGYVEANRIATKKWEQTYPDMQFSIALTDTFSTKVFFQQFDADTARRWKGIRQDSGDPFNFIDVAIHHYKSYGIDPATKIIIFSDSLNVDRCLKLALACKEKNIGCAFGIGTFLTNDFKCKSTGKHSVPMNIVIKLREVNRHPAIKISDDLTKTTGDPETVKDVKNQFGL